MRLHLACIAVTLGAAQAAADHYQDGRTHWLQGQYQAAYDTLLLARKEPYGRKAEVDYMIATSACRLGCCQTWGHNLLAAIPSSYPISEESLQVLTRARNQCLAQTPAAPESADILEHMVAAGVSGRAKVFSLPDEKVGLTTYAAKRLRTIPAADLEARLSRPSEGARAEGIASRLLSEGVKRGTPAIRAFPRFVIASTSGHSMADLDAIAATLDQFLTFIIREYGLAEPDRLITIYLVPEPGMVATLASSLHGLGVSPGTIGYAFQSDLSIVAFVRGQGVGTVLHELVHLTVRRNFGDVPQWLDEGIAGLYEVSTLCAGRTFGEPNWRGDVLQSFWHHRPTVEQLVGQDWFPFDVPEGRAGSEYIETTPAEKRVAAMAMARYFALFLERKQLLTRVYGSVRDRDFLAGQSAADAARTALESGAGETLTAIDAEFQRWFRAGVPTSSAKKSCASVERALPIEKTLPKQP